MLEKISSFPFSHLIRNKSIQNFIFLVIIQASNILISLISMPLLIQSIGVDQFGLVNLALSVIILMNILVGFGYNLSGPREVAVIQENREQLSHVFSNIISSKFLLATLATLLILIGVYGLGLFTEYQVILVFSVLLLFSEATLPLWFFQGMEKMKLISIANVFSKLLFLMGIVLFIHRPEQAKWVNFLLGGSALGINLLLLLYIHYALEIRFYKPRFKQIYLSLKENLLLFLSNLASHISINGGLIVLSFFSAAATLGMFSLAERITMVLRMLPALIIQAIYPNASKLYQSNLPGFFNFLKKTYLVTLSLGTGLSIFTFFTAPFIVEVLAKEPLEEAILFLKILAFVPFLACLNIINVTMLLVTDQKDQLFKASWQMCVFMLFASIGLTSQFGGVGLCIALLSTEVVIFMICTILIYKNNKDLFYGFQKALFGSHHHS
ncbi:oligosaccharide flippase family protein [Mongoliibacter ruber]|uniref:PST family polysaccharide transporter n=1 Tax=Mongoliibacter ruber TaxID=1750599 RepID=A0A2T0WT62_9BACT|nr:oligosaccharide flippase family protein [Mongoliibacter ruber]PRY89883.1 PST family polysaccharide transporter [Mongoliibacter ruber]